MLGTGCKSGKTLSGKSGPKIGQFGLQLYTLRDDMPKDPKGVLRQVAAAGYKQIESYEGPLGMWWGMSAKEFRAFNANLGMEVVASHCDVFKDFERKADQAAQAGLKCLICPWIGPQDSLDSYKKMADTFNEKGKICQQAGIRFGYHNHAYSFMKKDGQYPQDILMANTDPTLVDFELDIYWVKAANQNIKQWLTKYPERFRLCHIKDYSKTPGSDDGKNSVDLGKGVIDWSDILTAASKAGMQYYLVEQEAYPDTTPLEAVKSNGKYMQQFV